jgi:translation initiation factor IF-2
LNISLERAVDLKIRELLLKLIKTQKFLMMYTMSCAVSLQVTEAKEASKVGEEKRKEKEALRVERKLKISVSMTKKSTTTTRSY